MTNLFSKLKSGSNPAENGPAPRLTLAAFGKHPGWDDHIPGIGIETENLAYVKQTLYVGGIGKQIDSGAWEKLDAESRAAGFDHTFLWWRSGQVLLGEMWSSVDRKGRSKYPMVLCVNAEGLSANLTVAIGAPELDSLRAACQAATTDAQVNDACRAAQERLRFKLTGVAPVSAPPAPVAELRKPFLDRAELGPDRVGLKRLLHELGNFGAGHALQETTGQSKCLRVPPAAENLRDALVLWLEFFREISVAGSILVIGRKNAGWLDVIIGDPNASDFFCLQAGLKAWPLTTEIPYDLPPDLNRRWEQAESKFLGGPPPPAARAEAPKSAAPPPTSPPPVLAVPAKGKPKWIFFAIAGFIVVLGAAGLLTMKRSGSATPPVKETNAGSRPQEPQPLQSVEPAKPQVVSESPATSNAATPTQSQAAIAEPVAPAPAPNPYDVAMTDARAEMGKRNFAKAIAKADEALALKPNDPDALNLKTEASIHQKTIADAESQKSRFAQAMASAEAAYAKGDFTSALAQAGIALTIKTNDPSALKMKSNARSRLDLIEADAADRQAKYDDAMKAAKAAFEKGDYADATARATSALHTMTNDPAALKIIADVKAAQDAAAREADRKRKVAAILDDARAAFAKGDYTNAVKKTDAALALDTNNAAAVKIKHAAEAARDAALAAAERERKYQEAMSAANAAVASKDFQRAIEQADAALAIRTNDAPAAAIKKSAVYEKDFADARKFVEQGEFAKARSLCVAHAGDAAFDALMKKAGEKESDKYETELEVYQVGFGLLDAKDAKSADARKQSLLNGEIPLDQLNACLKRIDVLRANFKSAGKLDAARDKELNDLKQAILRHK